jgi:mannose-6-phosphate isomerase
MNRLYPLKFEPQILDKMWGGSKLKNFLNKSTSSNKAGESWEISGFEGHISEISNGFLAGNNLEELIEVYMGDLVGDRIFEKFGSKFPLLIKFIDASEVLSIQVHPDNEQARESHNSFGKTEMWYVLQADEGAELIIGFNRQVSKEIYLKQLNDKKLMSILNTVPVKSGDVFFIPCGRVHAIGAGILLAEIQQTSDATYRIYDFDRKDPEGNYRVLHTDLAVEAIDYNYYPEYRSNYENLENSPVEVVSCKYFTTNKLNLNVPFKRDISLLESFVIYMCVEGSCTIHYYENETVDLRKGESILIPASLSHYSITPEKSVTLLEVSVPPEESSDN